jgi:hypothetical protein
MKTEPHENNKQKEAAKADLETILRKQMEMDENLDKILEKLGITKKPLQPIDPSRILATQPDPNRLREGDFG